MGGLLERLHTTMVINQITARHALSTQDILSRAGLHIPSRLEDAIVGTFSRHHPAPQIYVHWGAYESGKSRAARVAAARLQQNFSKPVMLLQGYRMNSLTTLRNWLRSDIGVPLHCPDDKLSVFLPDDKQALVILDHADLVLHRHSAHDTYEALKELGIPVLVMVSSWEHALDLKNLGAQLLGTPGFARWTKEEIMELYHSLPETRSNRECYTEDFKTRVTLSRCPGIMISDALSGISERTARSHLLRAKIIDSEWRNGIRALNGEDMKGTTGRFPDKKGVYHWDNPNPA